ncbi:MULTISPECIES: hypothetical protein [unclassified Arthrobacter]|uniref:hypothetical protein n=1 Tax=unclassified Arthrobacter TaxID=235627 RepID=UPI0006F53FB9|nr:hypothetical protein [Arthrobacter sp. Soil764]KRE83271.1 hypothetical protein ASG86_08615 [Arthrobacter sp. Soil764]
MSAPRRAAAPRGSAAVVIALLSTLVLTGCQAATPAPADPTAATSPSAGSTMKTSSFSTLDAAGVENIRTTRTARLDMSSGRLEKDAVRVTEDSYGPEINTRDSGRISLSILAPNGEITAETDRIRFNTTDTRTDFSEVTYFLTAGSAEEFFELIRDGVQRYGISAESAEEWISSTQADPASRSDFSITPGTDTGLTVNYDLRYDGSKDTQVIIVHILPAA